MRNPLEELVGFQLVRTAAFGLRTLNLAYGDLNLRHPDAAVLLVIEANPGITQSSVGRMLNIQRSNMVPIMGRLSERGWVERRPGKGKSISLHLSEAGAEVMPRIRAASQTAETALAGPISADEFSALHSTLRQIGR